MSNYQNETINEEFSEVIREKMTPREFWNWASGWIDVDFILEEAEEWDLENKLEVIKSFKRGDYK